jgi:hypothetical protein
VKGKGEVLKIPCELVKISTAPGNVGGYNVTFHFPEFASDHVKPLIGMENKQAFIMVLARAD